MQFCVFFEELVLVAARNRQLGQRVLAIVRANLRNHRNMPFNRINRLHSMLPARCWGLQDMYQVHCLPLPAHTQLTHCIPASAVPRGKPLNPGGPSTHSSGACRRRPTRMPAAQQGHTAWLLNACALQSNRGSRVTDASAAQRRASGTCCTAEARPLMGVRTRAPAPSHP